MGFRHHPTRVALVAAPLMASLVGNVKLPLKPKDEEKMREAAKAAIILSLLLLDKAHPPAPGADPIPEGDGGNGKPPKKPKGKP